jgi:hypothetical protein
VLDRAAHDRAIFGGEMLVRGWLVIAFQRINVTATARSPELFAISR